MKMFKKILSLMLVVMMLLGCATVLASCGQNDDFKIGFICLHDESSTYDLNFINAALRFQQELELKDEQVIIKRNIAESEQCYEAAEDLVSQGCTIVFANSFGHEDYMIQAAKAFPDVEFCHATGTKAAEEKLPNYHNAFASIYEGRYLAGIAAGMKINEMIADGDITAAQAKMGYVGAYTYAEVISGYTSFYLGAKSVCPTVTMDVQFTGAWYDATEEKNAAEALIAGGCVLISQHADSMGAPGACEAAGVPNVSYNGSTVDACPDTFIISSAINWTPYYLYIADCVMNGKTIDTNWCGGMEQGSVILSDINTAVAAEGTAKALEDAAAALKAGTIHVFDTSKFTVGGNAPEHALISDGYFHESETISAPSFDLRIDGITLLNEKF